MTHDGWLRFEGFYGQLQCRFLGINECRGAVALLKGSVPIVLKLSLQI